MQKYFNVTGLCYPEKHYMVNLEGRLKEIKKLVDRGEYFVINRARQYGKTTILFQLAEKLSKEYVVFFISFEGMGDMAFASECAFCRWVCGLLYDTMAYGEVDGIPKEIQDEYYHISQTNEIEIDFRRFSNMLSYLCREVKKPVILIIDEVDQAGTQEIFLRFLGMLRDGYLKRIKRPAFQSVILAGVYNIKNLKIKFRPENMHQYNSPWNTHESNEASECLHSFADCPWKNRELAPYSIAADFDVDMSFSKEDITGMLFEYEKDFKTGMDVQEIAELIFAYTQGYPYMVSFLCKFLDEKLTGKGEIINSEDSWTKNGVLEAVKELLNTQNTLMDDMRKKIMDYPELKEILYIILFKGQAVPFNVDHFAIEIGVMFGFIKKVNGSVQVANRIFETRIYNMFLSEDLIYNISYQAGEQGKNQFIRNGELDMELVLRKFTEHFTDVYADCEESFLEENGRRFFLLYLKPIINGVGNYYIEARTRNQRRTDVIIDYRGKQYIVEMKIWHGEEYHQRGEEQLIGYLEDYHTTEGYLLSFNFNKKKTVGVREIFFNGHRMIEAVV